MGGKYRITGDKYPRMRPPRRRGRLVLMVVASVAALGVLGWGTLQLIDVYTGKASAAGTADCVKKASPSPSATVSLPQPGQITVNVYNATARSGLAKTTADELKKRGFKIGEVGNASKQYDKKVAGSAILLGTSASLKTALPVLGTQLSGAQLRADTRKTTDVDLIIGTGFKNLAKQTDATKALTALSAPQPAAGTKKKTC
ncbi:hypothetical protein WN71_015435 [Streptomyces mangrovisoli]|uniref:LytR/CpsA/Psr regulator C-terminal domain-containing protein n=2 Tax=Streptomyces mangrovisoli TaxID=1428628 RepID=A0A1J4NXP8_9ACTN|nr:hypothetical protein WN71_015435 [Streptomyces mangrovisoli]